VSLTTNEHPADFAAFGITVHGQSGSDRFFKRCELYGSENGHVIHDYIYGSSDWRVQAAHGWRIYSPPNGGEFLQSSS
jgi:hypothetical protein